MERLYFGYEIGVICWRCFYRIMSLTYVQLLNKYGCMTYSNSVRQAGVGGWSWSGVREKYCYLTGGWWLELK